MHQLKAFFALEMCIISYKPAPFHRKLLICGEINLGTVFASSALTQRPNESIWPAEDQFKTTFFKEKSGCPRPKTL